MKLQMHSVHFTADQDLLDFVQKKVDKLETFYDRITSGEVYMKVDKGEARKNKIVEIKLYVPGGSIFADGQDASFEAAADSATEALRRQVKKHKDKERGI